MPLSRAFEKFCAEHVHFEFVDCDKQLAGVLDHLRSVKAFEVSLDIETTALTPVRGVIALVQIGFRYPDGRCRQWLVDAFETDLTQLTPMLTSPRCTKLIHYSGFESNFFRVQFGINIVNVFDPRAGWSAVRSALSRLPDDQAERLVPRRPTGNSLQSIVEHRLLMRVPKDERVSDWAQRPLTAQQLQYAAVDAAVLPWIADDLREVMDRLDLTAERVEDARRESLHVCWGRDKLAYADEIDGSDVVRRALSAAAQLPGRKQLERQMRRWPLTWRNRQRLLSEFAAAEAVSA